MPTITLRVIAPEDHYRYFFPVTEYSFMASPPLVPDVERMERQKYGVERHALGLFEDDQPVAVISVIPMTQNVRGEVYTMGGIAPVATLPQARRKGYARDLMRAHFTYMHEQGMTFSGLYPFRESFYERLGYVTFPQIRIARFNPAALAPLVRLALPGAVSYGHLRDHFDLYRGFLLEQQAATHGMAYFPPIMATRLRDKEDEWLALARVAGQVVGCMTYKLTGYRETLRAQNFYYSSSAGKYLLLEWLARHTDQVRQIELHLPPYELAETWFADMDVKFSSTDWVTPMGRVLNVETLSGMQAGIGRFSAIIHDDYCEWNNRTYGFESVDGTLYVGVSHDMPACSLTIQGVSALVYGTHDPADFVLRGWAEGVTPELLATWQQMFPPARPHMHEQY